MQTSTKTGSILREFLESESAGGIVLMAAAALALVVANRHSRKSIMTFCTSISGRSVSFTGSTMP